MTHLLGDKIPAPLRGAESGTWAHSTITVRFKEILRRTLADNDFSAAQRARLEVLLEEIPHAPLRPLRDRSAPDAAAWDEYLRPYGGQDWLHVPWFLAEHYFYRRILEAVGYFLPGEGEGCDPFAAAKRRGLAQGLKDFPRRLAALARWREELPPEKRLEYLLYADLWGNQADYSLWPAEAGQRPDHASTDAAAEHLLWDDIPSIARCLVSASARGRRVDLVADNAGAELLLDLALADETLTLGAASVVLHLKAHPTFVSDALAADVVSTLEALRAQGETHTRALAERLMARLEEGRLVLQPHFFWNSPLEGWRLPADLRAMFAQAALVISKGDANYRRWVGDRHWEFTTPFAQVMAYFPAPFAALRTLKAEVVCGLQPGQAERTARRDPDWMVNGRWGLAQFRPIPESTSRSPAPV
ncbi:MAG: protein-glutamate O-methyltransferase family protein [Anaerolineae bacterium]|nr:MAG: protein-glutamate O-methyltransferase family protein [Anaerolineae bacterium]